MESAHLSRQAWVAAFAGLLFGQRRNSKWPMWLAVSSIRTLEEKVMSRGGGKHRGKRLMPTLMTWPFVYFLVTMPRP